MKRNQTFHEKLIPLLVEGVGAESYLEFGIHFGETFLKVKANQIVGVDLEFSPPWLTKGTWPVGPGMKIFEMSTSEFIETHAAKYAPYDFVFIDADHSAEAVEKDFHGIYPHVADEGLICLHDTNPESVHDTDPKLCGDAWLFAQKLPKEFTCEAVTLPYHPGLTIIRKRISWGPK